MSNKEATTHLKVILPESDKENLREQATEHSGGMSGLALDFIQQGLGKRKLGDYLHIQNHEDTLAAKNREIAGLNKKAKETAENWESVMIALGLNDELRAAIKDIPLWCRQRVHIIIGLERAATGRNEGYEKKIAELQETTILRTEHEQRVDDISKAKMEVETQLKAETESVERLNVKLTEQESEIDKLNTESDEQEHTIGSLQDELKLTRSDVRTWQKNYSEASQKSWWRKLLGTLKREAIITPVINHEPELDELEDEDAREQSTP